MAFAPWARRRWRTWSFLAEERDRLSTQAISRMLRGVLDFQVDMKRLRAHESKSAASPADAMRESCSEILCLGGVPITRRMPRH